MLWVAFDDLSDLKWPRFLMATETMAKQCPTSPSKSSPERLKVQRHG